MNPPLSKAEAAVFFVMMLCLVIALGGIIGGAILVLKTQSLSILFGCGGLFVGILLGANILR